MEARLKLGNEPPPHVHLWENEVYHLLEGTAEFFVEGQEQSLVAKSGDTVFLPWGKAHAFYIRSNRFRTILTFQATGDAMSGTADYFLEVSEPATSMHFPEKAVTYAVADIHQVAMKARKHGVEILTPVETKHRLPNYPGFGANLESVMHLKPES